jgi:alkylated DNA nucleotide flippase Atl1
LSNFKKSSDYLLPTVDALFKKHAQGKPVQAVDELQLIAGEGIEADVTMSISSPRQVLIVRKEDLDAFRLPIGYLKENIVVSGLPVEDFQPGRSLCFDSGVSVHLVFHCEPCQTIAERIPNLKSIIQRRGLLGVVTQSGRILRGARCESIASSLVSMPSNARDRVCQVVSRIPKGCVLDYATLLHAAGLQRVYFRAIPSYLKHAQAVGLPVHRVVTSRFEIPAFIVDEPRRLSSELDLESIKRYRWEPKILDILSTNPLFTASP